MTAWYLVHARPRQEAVAAEHLARQGYAVYLPQLSLPRLRRARWHDAVEPLFPRYLFAGVRNDDQSIHPIRSTRGVAALVRNGPAYRPVPDELLAQLQARQDAQGMHRLNDAPLAHGDRVHIVAGPFAGLDAIFESQQGAARVRVLLDVIGGVTRALLPASLIVRAMESRWNAREERLTAAC